MARAFPIPGTSDRRCLPARSACPGGARGHAGAWQGARAGDLSPPTPRGSGEVHLQRGPGGQPRASAEGTKKTVKRIQTAGERPKALPCLGVKRRRPPTDEREAMNSRAGGTVRNT